MTFVVSDICCANIEVDRLDPLLDADRSAVDDAKEIVSDARGLLARDGGLLFPREAGFPGEYDSSGGVFFSSNEETRGFNGVSGTAPTAGGAIS